MQPVSSRLPVPSSLAPWRLSAIFDGGRRELISVSVLAALLVFLRGTPVSFWQGLYFDSDQAVIGLMAKHISEFRAFPLFFYGQNYMLAVQAWIIAPFFWLAGPSVAMMRLPLILLNALAAVVLLRGLSSELRLRPAVAFVASLPFGSLVLQAEMIGHHLSFPWSEAWIRVQYIFTECVPVLLSGERLPLQAFAMRSSAVVGSPVIGG
jgi:hypothetical protein